MPPMRELSGQEFDRLTVTATFRRIGRPTGGTYIEWLCECQCGKKTWQRSRKLTKGDVVSCGCYRRDITIERSTTHGATGTHEYNCWSCMVQRRDERHVHSAWLKSFADFLAHIGLAPSPRHQIDRIDNTRGYVPGNVRWATAKQQARNRGNNRLLQHEGRTACLSELAEAHGIAAGTVAARLKRGWTVAEALTTPV